MRPRTTAVTVFAILAICWGGMGLLGDLMRLALTLLRSVSSAGIGASNPITSAMESDATYQLFMKIFLPFDILMPIVLILAGVGMLKLKSWGRHLAIAYSVVAIVLVFGRIYMTVAVVMPMMQRTLDTGDPALALGLKIGTFAGVAGNLLSFLFPGLMLVYCMLPNFAAAFRSPSETAMTPPPMPLA